MSCRLDSIHKRVMANICLCGAIRILHANLQNQCQSLVPDVDHLSYLKSHQKSGWQWFLSVVSARILYLKKSQEYTKPKDAFSTSHGECPQVEYNLSVVETGVSKSCMALLPTCDVYFYLVNCVQQDVMRFVDL